MKLPAWARRLCTPSRVLLVLTLLPLLTAVIHAVRAGWVPIGDHGLIEVRATDVFTSNNPMLGTWTSASLSAHIDLNNPGPLLFIALAPFVKWFGVSTGAVIGVAVINGAAVAIALRQGRVLAGRRGELLMAGTCLTLMWSMGSEMLIDNWQPHVLLLPFLAFLACAASAAAGHLSAVPWLVGLASFLVQTHLSFTYVVGIVGLAALGLCGWVVRASRVDAPQPWRRWSAIAGATALVCWCLPLYEQFFGVGEGNLSRLVRASTTGNADDDTIGARLGIRLVARIVALPPWFLRPSFADSIPITPRSADGQVHAASWPPLLLALVALVALIAVAVWLVRRLRQVGDTALATLLIILLVGIGAALITMMVLPLGPLGLAPHQMRWLWPMSVLLWWALGAAALRLAPAGGPILARRAQIALAAILVLVVVNLPAHLTDAGPSTFRQYRGVLSTLIRDIGKVHLDQPAVFDVSTLRFAEPFSGPVLLVLLDHDQPVRVSDEGFIRQLGEGRRAHGDEEWNIEIVEGEAARELGPDDSLLAYVDGLSNAEHEELDALQADGGDQARIDQLIRKRSDLEVAVVLTPRG